MTHFGLVCPAFTGHLNTILPLGQELKQRGHTITLVSTLDAKDAADKAGFNFYPVGKEEFPTGAIVTFGTTLGSLKGLKQTHYSNQWFGQQEAVHLRDLPLAIETLGLQALLIDQIWVGAPTIAQARNLPFITICSALLLNREPDIPPFTAQWDYNPTLWNRIRNTIGNWYFDLTCLNPTRKVVVQWRQAHQLSVPKTWDEYYSPLAQLSQQPPGFEFPRKQLPAWFHFTGPYHSAQAREPIPFPYDRLKDKPLIYASMGTLHNRNLSIFETIAQACASFAVQVVISLGGSAEPDDLPPLAGDPIIVKYAPQLELLQRATLAITHAGLNTTLEALTNGVPLVAIPIMGDQFPNAARLVWCGAGQRVKLNRSQQLKVDELRGAIEAVLTQKSYKNNALKMQQAIHQAGGVQRAAEIIEQAATTCQPVIAPES